MKCLFLDIDGVLNDHGQMLNLYCGIHKDKIELLNQVVEKTECYIVISSAWRYMILGGAMTIEGFEYMLMTHGFIGCKTIVGYTQSDEKIKTRGLQIKDWLDNSVNKAERYVVVDDIDLGISECGHPFIQTNGKVGLTQDDVDKIIEILNG